MKLSVCSTITAVVAVAIVAYVGYRVAKERKKLKERIGLLGPQDRSLIGTVEALVLSGQLQSLTRPNGQTMT